MATHEPNAEVPRGTAADLGRLNDLDDYKVADGYPDIRGWEVKTADGTKVGTVGDLIVDTREMRVRYLDVELDRDVAQLARDAATPGDQERHTLLPIGSVELNDDTDDVRVGRYAASQIAALPRYGGRSITREYESSLVRGHRGLTGTGAGVAGAAAAAGAAMQRGAEQVADAVTGDDPRHDYDHDDFDDQRLYARRRAAGAEAQRVTLAEERLDVGTRATSAGEAQVRKVVDTERVQEQVQLRRDEVTVERRPITDASPAAGAAQIGNDEIRVPIMEERLVVEKKLVPREEIIVRKRAVTEQQTVQADVRRERLDVEGAKDTVEGTVDDADRR